MPVVKAGRYKYRNAVFGIDLFKPAFFDQVLAFIGIASCIAYQAAEAGIACVVACQQDQTKPVFQSEFTADNQFDPGFFCCLLYTSPSPRD